LDQTFGLTGS